MAGNEKYSAKVIYDLRKGVNAYGRAASGSAQSMSNISKERLGKIQIICPPISEQERLLPLMKQIDKSKLAIYKIKKMYWEGD